MFVFEHCVWQHKQADRDLTFFPDKKLNKKIILINISTNLLFVPSTLFEFRFAPTLTLINRENHALFNLCNFYVI